MIFTKYTQVGDNVAMQMVSVLGLLLELSKYTRLNLSCIKPLCLLFIETKSYLKIKYFS